MLKLTFIMHDGSTQYFEANILTKHADQLLDELKHKLSHVTDDETILTIWVEDFKGKRSEFAFAPAKVESFRFEVNDDIVYVG